MLFFSRWNPVRFGQDTYKEEGNRSARFVGEDGSTHTDRPLPLWIMLLRDMVRPLVFKIGCRDNRFREREKSISRGLLSQVTVRRIKQLGLQMYVVTRSFTRPISDSFPP